MSTLRRLAGLLLAALLVPACDGEDGLQPAQLTFRVSTAPGNLEAGEDSFSPTLTGDGRFVAFASQARELVPSLVDGMQDIFIKDRQTGGVENITFLKTFGGTFGPVRGTCSSPAFSADGTSVAFLCDSDIEPVEAAAPNVPYYTPAVHTTTNVFVWKRGVAGFNKAIHSVAFSSWPATNITEPSLSADGRYLAFATDDSGMSGYSGSGTGPAGSIQIYVTDLQTRATKLVSKQFGVNTGCNGHCAHPQISSDGTWVVYDSEATNLISGGTSFNQVFRSKADGTSTELLSRAPLANGNAPADLNSWFPRISSDGRYVTFLCNAGNVIAGIPQDLLDRTGFLVRRDVQLGENVLIYRFPFIVSRSGSIMYPPPTGSAAPISDDGGVVVFLSRDPALTGGSNTTQVFTWYASTGTISLSSVNSLTGALAFLESTNPAISADGRWAAWDTFADSLIPLDQNGVADVYVRGPLR